MQITLHQLRNPVLYLAVAVLLMVKCEAMFFGQFGLVLQQHPVYYLGALVLTFPILMVLADHRTLRRWQESSNISSAAALQVKRTMTSLILLTYGLVYMVLAFGWRASQ